MNVFISEIFKSFQGEGALVGLSSLFVRFAGCNLNCSWCDTKYSWNRRDPDFKVEKISEDALIRRLNSELTTGRQVSNIVLTGGEPLLQLPRLKKLWSWFRHQKKVIEIETNGTKQMPINMLKENPRVIFNVSPKYNWNAGVTKGLGCDCGYFVGLAMAGVTVYFKFVVETDEQVEKVMQIVRKYNIPPVLVFFMPQVTTKKEYEKKAKWVLQKAMENNVRFSQRLQVQFFGNKKGV